MLLSDFHIHTKWSDGKLSVAAFVVGGTALAAALRRPCLVGKSVALTRTALQAIGGFDAFSEVLAEDQAMAIAFQKSGYGIVLSSFVVKNVIVDRTIRRAFDRMTRWNKIRFSFSRSLYTAELLMNPLPLALAAAIMAGFVAPSMASQASGLLVSAGISRLAFVALVSALAGSPLTSLQMLTVPAHDALQFVAYFVPFFSNRVCWKGHRARLGRHSAILPLDQAGAAL